MPVIITGALMVTAVTASAVRGAAQASVVAVLVGSLLIAYFTRHWVRARLVYDRRPHTRDEARRESAAAQKPPG
jgi:membrane protein implicated in regulation of membrane protease activity